MANQFLTGAAWLKLYWSLNGELAINTLGLQVSASTPPTFGQALADTLGGTIKGLFTTHLAGLMPASSQLVRVGVRDWRTANQPEYRDTGAAATGTGTGDPLPRGAAVCITLRTAGSGKSFRGRAFFSGFTETQNDTGGNQAATAGNGCASFLNAVAVGLPAGLTLAVISRPSDEIRLVRTRLINGTVVETDTISTTAQKAGAVNGVTATESRNNRWEYQRRRDNGRGTGAIGALTPVISIPVET